jgi:hypothetical protein
MKLIILHLDSANKPSLISESVTEIRIRNQLCKGITWQHDTRRPGGHHEWQQFHDEVKERIRAHLTLVHVFHTYALVNTTWVAHALSH